MARPRLDSGAVPTPERILSAAHLAFSRQGFTLATLGDIAADAGIRRSSLLYHYPSKAALYEAVVAGTFERLALALRLPMGIEGSFEERLRLLVEGFVTFMDADPNAATILVREVIAAEGPGQAILLRTVSPLFDEVERWLKDAGADEVRSDVNLRRAIMQIVSDTLVRNAAGPLSHELWG